jgi:hypothetical protein
MGNREINKEINAIFKKHFDWLKKDYGYKVYEKYIYSLLIGVTFLRENVCISISLDVRDWYVQTEFIYLLYKDKQRIDFLDEKNMYRVPLSYISGVSQNRKEDMDNLFKIESDNIKKYAMKLVEGDVDLFFKLSMGYKEKIKKYWEEKGNLENKH